MSQTSKKLHQGWALAIETLVVLGLFAGVLLWVVPDLVTALRVLVRTTARISLVLFSMAFVASSARTLWSSSPFTKWLAQNRRYIGVSFAISHIFHGMGIIGLAIFDTENFMANTPWTTFVFGGLVYVFILFMLITSFDKTTRMLPPRVWKLGHQMGNYGIWLVFLVSYVGRVFTGQWVYTPLFILSIATFAIRLLAWKKKKQLKTISA